MAKAMTNFHFYWSPSLTNFETVDKKLKIQTEVAKANKLYAEEIRKDLESLESLVTAFRE